MESLDLHRMLWDIQSGDLRQTRALSAVQPTARQLFGSGMSSEACETWDHPTVDGFCDVTSSMAALYEHCHRDLQEVSDWQ